MENGSKRQQPVLLEVVIILIYLGSFFTPNKTFAHIPTYSRLDPFLFFGSEPDLDKVVRQ